MSVLLYGRGKLIVEITGRIFDFDSGWECMDKFIAGALARH